MKRIICAFFVLGMLIGIVGCGSSTGNPSETSSFSSQSEAEAPPNKRNTDFHSYTYDNYQWLDHSGTLAIENEGNISYLSLDNEVTSTGKIEKQYFPDEHLSYQISWNNDSMALLSQTLFVQIDGEWMLSNFSVHHHDGSLIKSFSTTEYKDDFTSILIDGAEYPLSELPCSRIWQMLWVDSDELLLYNNKHLFLLNIETESIDLLADFSALVEPHGKFGVYYGLSDVVVTEEKDILYLAHDIEEASNTLGTFYTLRKSDHYQTPIKGEIYVAMRSWNGVATLRRDNYEDATDRNTEIQLFYSTDEEVLPLATFSCAAWTYNVVAIPSGKRILVQSDEEGFWVYDIKEKNIVNAYNYIPHTDMPNSHFVAVYGEADDLTLAFAENGGKSYLYHQGDQEATPLKNQIKSWQNISLFVSDAYFIEMNDDYNGLRILPIE